MYQLQTRKLTKGLIKLIPLCKALKVPVGLGPGTGLWLPLNDMENKEPAPIFTLGLFPHQEPELGEAEGPSGPREDQAPLG